MNTIQYHSPNGVRYGLLVNITPKFLYILIQEPNMHVQKLPRKEDKYIKYLSTPSTRQMKQRMKQAAKEWHCLLSQTTKVALRISS